MSGEDATVEVGDVSTPSGESAASQTALPEAIGRYEVQGTLGTGGMGVVYEARDPQLDRTVALKLVRPGTGGPEATVRLLREAQAMAQLTHPNVVPVYDVGTIGTQVFVAMELIEGQTLSSWLERAPSWRDVVAVMTQAGRGLAAAHAAGLLHRDFKPDNVMIGDDGRVRVMDFGLARVQSEPSQTDRRAPSVVSSDSLETPLTHASSIMGTPAYMAPEQHTGGELDPRADQFAFCVALYRALYRQRPYTGRSSELAAKKMNREISPPPPDAGVPGWVHAVLLKGLSPGRLDRWPTMDALLVALDPARRTRRRAAVFSVVGLGMAAAGAAAAVPSLRNSIDEAGVDCTAQGEKIEDVWSEARRAEVREAFAASEAPFALPSFDRAATWIDGYASRWKRLRVASCQREVDGTAVASLEDRRRLCLDRARGELDALIEELAAGGSETIQSAVTNATSLPSLARCDDDETLRTSVVPPPASKRAEVRDLRDRIAKAARGMASSEDEVAQAERRVEEARATAYDPVVAEALNAFAGRLRASGKDYERSVETYEEAYHLASAAGHHLAAFEAARQLVYVHAFHTGRYVESETWAGHARAVLVRLGGAPRQEIMLRNSIAALHQERGASDEAMVEYRRILEIHEQQQLTDTPSYANLFNGMGDLYRRMDRLDEARESLERAISIYEEIYGEDHPDMFSAIGNLAVVARMQGDHDTAEPLLKRTVELAKATFGPEHPNVAMAMGNYANLFWERGNYQRAYELSYDAAERLKRTVGPEHPAYAMALDNAGGYLAAMERFDEARPLIARALDIRQRVLGEDHLEVARSLTNVANVAKETGELDKALRTYERAIDVLDRTVGASHRETLRARNGAAVVLEGLGRDGEAEAMRRVVARHCAKQPEFSACEEAREALGLPANDEGNSAEVTP